MSKDTAGATNALTKVTTRENGNGLCRTALRLTEGEAASVDVLFPNGDLMCRLNIVSDENNDWGNVITTIRKMEKEGIEWKQINATLLGKRAFK